MRCWSYNHNELFVEGVPLSLLAQEYGTPLYVYSKTIIEKNWQTFTAAFKSQPHQICYAVKANSNLAILNLLANLGAGFDIVSLGELIRVMHAAGNVNKVIFSGVGKTAGEIERAIQSDIFCFNIESAGEFARLATISKNLSKKINIALRINPNVEAKTHAYIATGKQENKFGLEPNTALNLFSQIVNEPSLNLMGLAFHIGSQLTTLTPFLKALDCVLQLYDILTKEGAKITHINIGGGLGITYQDETPPSIVDYSLAIKAKLKDLPIQLILEPGRAIVGDSGMLITRIEYIKEMPKRNFIITDAGMNDLLRPALYDAFQTILPVKESTSPKKVYDIVGPVCESSDFLGKERALAVEVGDLLAIDCVGAYGFSMSSNYNTRGRAAEVLVSNEKHHLIRKRESISDLLQLESII